MTVVSKIIPTAIYVLAILPVQRLILLATACPISFVRRLAPNALVINVSSRLNHLATAVAVLAMIKKIVAPA